jgi:hypothetical protein
LKITFFFCFITVKLQFQHLQQHLAAILPLLFVTLQVRLLTIAGFQALPFERTLALAPMSLRRGRDPPVMMLALLLKRGLIIWWLASEPGLLLPPLRLWAPPSQTFRALF